MNANICMKSALLALLLSAGAGVALAQKPDRPPNTGQAPVSREAVKQEARQASRNTANTNVPAVGGEASTMTNHQPNMQPVPISGKTRAEVRQETYHQKPHFGQPGEKTGIPTNPPGKMGTPE
ncbi:MAG: serine/threonine protein kinase [Proteobacteria bacterium]|nr:serine/threonine protein kinase [Pseudomonadota bacterium]